MPYIIHRISCILNNIKYIISSISNIDIMLVYHSLQSKDIIRYQKMYFVCYMYSIM